MNYSLAKQLKDAGFQQPTTFEGHYLPAQGKDVGVCYAPTLAELIEACGDRFYELLKFDGKWDAVAHKGNDDVLVEQGYETPEIAVAKLWLELNK